MLSGALTPGLAHVDWHLTDKSTNVSVVDCYCAKMAFKMSTICVSVMKMHWWTNKSNNCPVNKDTGQNAKKRKTMW